MARKKKVEITLDTLIPQYAENKQIMDDYKKICDEENKQIKNMMGEGSYEAGGFTATKSIQRRQSMNEDKLLELMQKHGIAYDKGVIKTKEYVDLDVLESLIYEDEIPKELLLEIDKCRDVKEVVVLKVTKTKEEK